MAISNKHKKQFEWMTIEGIKNNLVKDLIWDNLIFDDAVKKSIYLRRMGTKTFVVSRKVIKSKLLEELFK